MQERRTDSEVHNATAAPHYQPKSPSTGTQHYAHVYVPHHAAAESDANGNDTALHERRAVCELDVGSKSTDSAVLQTPKLASRNFAGHHTPSSAEANFRSAPYDSRASSPALGEISLQPSPEQSFRLSPANQSFRLSPAAQYQELPTQTSSRPLIALQEKQEQQVTNSPSHALQVLSGCDEFEDITCLRQVGDYSVKVLESTNHSHSAEHRLHGSRTACTNAGMHRS